MLLTPTYNRNQGPDDFPGSPHKTRIVIDGLSLRDMHTRIYAYILIYSQQEL